jgi:NTP pyrophosphatase (non-canonical NTP hydrolase)
MLIKLQKEVHDWVSQFKDPYYPPLSILAHITEEVGELARELNNRFGPRTKKSPQDTAEISDEIADIIFDLICLANSSDIYLDAAWKKKMSKCWERDKDRYEKVA